MKDLDKIQKSPLFVNIPEIELINVLSSLDAKVKTLKKNSYVFLEGDKIETIKILLSGELSIVKDDENGNQIIVNKVLPTEMFGEAFVCSGQMVAAVSVLCDDDCEIMSINFNKVFEVSQSQNVTSLKIIKNMMQLLSRKLITLNTRLELVSKVTTREKLLTFLTAQKRIHKSNKFTISFNRQELASFLFVDRSAMSRELSKMKTDGIIDYNKNEFIVL